MSIGFCAFIATICMILYMSFSYVKTRCCTVKLHKHPRNNSDARVAITLSSWLWGCHNVLWVHQGIHWISVKKRKKPPGDQNFHYCNYFKLNSHKPEIYSLARRELQVRLPPFQLNHRHCNWFWFTKTEKATVLSTHVTLEFYMFTISCLPKTWR